MVVPVVGRNPRGRVEAHVAKDMAVPEEVHLKNVRQLTFGGDNAEAYWAFGGDRLILQSNHKPYKCDQIEELDYDVFRYMADHNKTYGFNINIYDSPESIPTLWLIDKQGKLISH